MIKMLLVNDFELSSRGNEFAKINLRIFPIKIDPKFISLQLH